MKNNQGNIRESCRGGELVIGMRRERVIERAGGTLYTAVTPRPIMDFQSIERFVCGSHPDHDYDRQTNIPAEHGHPRNTNFPAEHSQPASFFSGTSIWMVPSATTDGHVWERELKRDWLLVGGLGSVEYLRQHRYFRIHLDGPQRLPNAKKVRSSVVGGCQI